MTERRKKEKEEKPAPLAEESVSASSSPSWEPVLLGAPRESPAATAAAAAAAAAAAVTPAITVASDGKGENIENVKRESRADKGKSKSESESKVPARGSGKDLPAVKLRMCKACNSVSYCGEECQIAAWKAGHRKHCRKDGCPKKGDRITIQGLKGDTSRNGRFATVTTDAVQGSHGETRYGVRLATGETISVQPKNLLYMSKEE